MVGDYNTGYTTGAFNRLIRMDHPDLMKQIRIIWQSPLIPNGPIPVSNALPADFKAKVVAGSEKAGRRIACFIKAMGGTQHIGPGKAWLTFSRLLIGKRELVSALILPQRRLRPRVSGDAESPTLKTATEFERYYQQVRSRQKHAMPSGRCCYWRSILPPAALSREFNLTIWRSLPA